MLPDREGLFHANPVECGVAETGPKNLVTCVIKFNIFEELRDGQWTDCSEEKLEITGYFFVEKKDGSINTLAVDSLKAALGWDGQDLFWLQDTDLSDHPVQIRLGFDDYSGTRRIKVQFLNPFGSTGGQVVKSDDSERRAITNRIASKLRAVAAPRPAPSKPPTAPQATQRKSPPVKESTMDEAWAAFTAACPDTWQQQHVESTWFNVLQTFFPGKKPEELTPADWGVILVEGPKNVIPY